MLAAEVFVPGIKNGIAGGLCLTGAVAVAFVYYDALTASLVFAGVCVLTIGGFIGWLSAFRIPRSARESCSKKSFKWGRRTRFSLRIAWSAGTVTYSPAPSGFGIHRRQKGRRC